LKIFEENKNKDAIVWKDKVFDYKWLLERINYWNEIILSEKIRIGTVTVLEAEFSPNSVALFLSLIENSCIVVPLTRSVGAKKAEFMEIVQGEVSFIIDSYDNVKINRTQNIANHEFYHKLKRMNCPGLILFSSGSTGKSKASIHNISGILEKFKVARHRFRTITFLLYDHIGGINTMLYALSNAGCIVTVQNNSPDEVLKAIEKYKVELLPTSPTFINLILLSEAYNHYDISSLKILTYGTEPMPESTLRNFHALFPNVKMLQTYGLSEVGILRSKSKSSDSIWLKVGGEGFQTRVVDGILEIKAKSAMLGYLNAPNPFTEDGWFHTGDAVIVDGEYIKVLGRKSELINVGGEKVYPAEVESVIHEFKNVRDVIVYGERNAIIGNAVCAKISLLNDEDHKNFVIGLKKHCNSKLEKFKVPIKIVIDNDIVPSRRFKKLRS
jgi:acyl-CoA synthetase (AMP-forming)/AMP-acid ligase II